MLQVHSLSVAYGENKVVDGVSFQVLPGEILAMIGPNGAGKSTIIRAISGVTPILSGGVLVNGLDLSTCSTRQRAKILSVVPQARQLGGAFTVEQAVMMGRTPHLNWLGREGQADRASVRKALKYTSLDDYADRQIATLSGGEQQRVLLARALAQKTPVMLLDEPTNHLDLQHQANLLSLVRELARKNQLAVLMALHDLNLVSFFADKVALILDGHLKHLGTPGEVIRVEHITAAYQTPVDVIPHPVSGIPLIFPRGTVEAHEE